MGGNLATSILRKRIKIRTQMHPHLHRLQPRFLNSLSLLLLPSLLFSIISRLIRKKMSQTADKSVLLAPGEKLIGTNFIDEELFPDCSLH